MKKLNLLFVLLILTPLFSFQPATNNSIKVALLLDTSNSMDGLIDQAKSQLWNVVNELSVAKCNGETPKLEIALYEYGNDQLSMREGYIRLVNPFTRDLDLISEKLFSLKTDGGSEYCGQVIQSSLKALDWDENPNDLKMVFIAGNEPFDQGNVDFREVCKNARNREIIINTIFCGNFEKGANTFWKDGAYIGGGNYMNIDKDVQYVHIKTPFDDKIIELNKQLNKTYVAYGARGEKSYLRQAEQDKNAYSMNEEVAIQRISSKSKSAYKNSHWDLIDAASDENFELESLDENDLPKEMKNMTKEERIKYIEEKANNRKEIVNQINELTLMRDKYVAQQRVNDPENMLDKAIVNSVKKQAASKNFVFEK